MIHNPYAQIYSHHLMFSHLEPTVLNPTYHLKSHLSNENICSSHFQSSFISATFFLTLKNNTLEDKELFLKIGKIYSTYIAQI